MNRANRSARFRRLVPVALLLAAAAMLAGSPVGLSQEEETDVCAAVFEPEEEWSAQAWSYCWVYCEDLDCDGTPAAEDEALCLELLDQYGDATGGRIPPCEPQE